MKSSPRLRRAWLTCLAAALLGCQSAPKHRTLPLQPPDITACIFSFREDPPHLECNRPILDFVSKLGCLPLEDLEALYIYWENRAIGGSVNSEREPKESQ